MRQHHPFEPVVDARSHILILGSFPSLTSIAQDFYYAHPRNQFWKIMEDLFGETLPDTTAKTAFLLRRHIALWDVYASLRRDNGNSSDANLKELEPNDIVGLLRTYPSIHQLFCNGRKAAQGMYKHFPHIACTLLPSTSPAYAAMGFEAKLNAYAQIRESLETYLH